jgi:hypothetical protein
MARSIGETLDSRRTPTPLDNDLDAIALAYVALRNGDTRAAEASPVIKLISADKFTADDRWDVPRFWDDDELVQIGYRAAPITRSEFLDEAESAISALADDLDEARKELEALAPSQTIPIPLSDGQRFWIRPGKRITHAQLLEHGGDLPVYSCFTKAHMEKGRVDEEWVREREIPIIDAPCVTVNATGASGVGIVFVRENRCVLTDDVIAISPETVDIDLYYLAAALRSAVADGDFQYEAKLYQARLKALVLVFPVTETGELDLELQRRIGKAVRRVESLQERLSELGRWSTGARLT